MKMPQPLAVPDRVLRYGADTQLCQRDHRYLGDAQVSLQDRPSHGNALSLGGKLTLILVCPPVAAQDDCNLCARRRRGANILARHGIGIKDDPQCLFRIPV